MGSDRDIHGIELLNSDMCHVSIVILLLQKRQSFYCTHRWRQRCKLYCFRV